MGRDPLAQGRSERRRVRRGRGIHQKVNTREAAMVNTIYNMRKKIIYIITKGNFGGAQRYVFDLATSLAKENFDVLVATGEGTTLNEKLERCHIRTTSIPFLKRNINPLQEIIALFSLLKLFREERPDIIHLNSSKAGALGGLAGRLAKVPKIIFTGHGWAFNEERSFVSRILIGITHWITILLSHKTIAVSKRVFDQISIFPFIGKKITIVHNGIGPQNYLPKEEARQELYKEKTESLWIGTISELHKNKGLDFIIQAFAKIASTNKNIELFIIGDGEEQKKLRALSQKLGIQNIVNFLGFKKEASRYLQAFDIFTLTSRTEAFPYALLEAGSAGVPIIASRVGGIPELISNKENGILVEPGNIFDIEYALRDLIQNPEKRNTFSLLLKKKVEEFFSLKVMLSNTLEIYNSENR